MSEEPATVPGDNRLSAGDHAEHRRTDLASPHEEGSFRTLCERSLAGIYIVQDNGIKYVNPALAEALNRPMGKSIKSIPRRTMQQLQQYSRPGNGLSGRSFSALLPMTRTS